MSVCYAIKITTNIPQPGQILYLHLHLGLRSSRKRNPVTTAGHFESVHILSVFPSLSLFSPQKMQSAKVRG